MAIPEVAERKALVLTILGMALLCAALGAGAYFVYKETEKLQAENNELVAAVKELVKKREALPGKREELKKAESEKTRYEALLPLGKEQIEDLFARLGKAAKHLQIKDIRRIEERAVIGGRQPEQKPYKEIAFQFVFSGTFHQFAEFISIIENHQKFGRFIAVSNLEITAQDRGLVRDDNEQQHKFKIRLATYRYEAAQQAAAADPLAGINPGVLAHYRSLGMSDDDIIRRITGAADGGPTAAVGQVIFDPLAEEVAAPYKKYLPELRYTPENRIDPFTFAALVDRPIERPIGPVKTNGDDEERLTLEQKRKKVSELTDEAAARLKAGASTQALEACREALKLIQGMRGKLDNQKPEVTGLMLKALIGAASADLGAGSYHAAAQKCREAQDIIDKGAGLLDEERPAVDQLFLTAQRLERRRQIENEFARLNLKITMLAWRPRGATAVVNGTLVEEGSRIAPPAQGQEAVCVYRILPQGVVFLYRGVKFMRRLNAPEAAPSARGTAPTGS